LSYNAASPFAVSACVQNAALTEMQTDFSRPEILRSTHSPQPSPTNRDTRLISPWDFNGTKKQSNGRPIKSCIRCRNKKLGCNKKNPSCSQCERHRTLCCYPEQSDTVTGTMTHPESLCRRVPLQDGVAQTRHESISTENGDSSRCFEAAHSIMNPEKRSKY
jgi:hypothetical protein